MAKSSFTAKEAIGYVIGILKPYCQNQNFDRGEILSLLKFSIINLKEFLEEQHQIFLFRVETELTGVSQTVDNVVFYVTTAFENQIEEIVGLSISGIGRIELVPSEKFVGAIGNPEFSQQPIATKIASYVKVYFGDILTAPPVTLIWMSAPAFPGDENSVLEIPDKYFPLFVFWVSRLVCTNNLGIPVPVGITDQINTQLSIVTGGQVASNIHA